MQFATDRRRPAWTYSTRGVLWHLQTGSPEFLVGEDRILDAKEVSFFCLDRKTGVPRWEGLIPDDRWWSGIEAVAGGLVLLHGFASPDMPLHRGLTAVDLGSGAVVWSRPAVRFLRVEGDAIVVVKDGWEGGSVGRLEIGTGATLGEAERLRPPVGVAGRRDPQTRLPQPFVETAIEDAVLLAAIRSVIPETVRPESIVGVRWDDHYVLSYCEPCSDRAGEESGFRSSLVVLGGVRWAPLFLDVLQEAVAAIAAEPFFCQEGILYFVKERSTLVAVPLRVP
jgi:hypothetical protein